MKTTTIIIAAVLTIQFNALSADNPGKENSFKNDAISTHATALAPVTPSEADFSDLLPEPLVSLAAMAPTAPAEADFNDIVAEM